MNETTNQEQLAEQAYQVLKNVIDPEIGLNVVDMGLIYQIDFYEDEKRIEVIMTLTTQFCPMGETITHDVNQTLSDTFKDYKINIELTFDPPWNFDMISEEGKIFLQG